MVRLIVIIIAIMSAILFTLYVVEPLVLEPLCFTNTNNCLKISYQLFENSVLFHMIPTGYWVWFNGKYLYVYGEPTGQQCEDSAYQVSYVVDTYANKILGYQCTARLEDIQSFYNNQKSDMKYLFMRSDPEKTNVFNVFNMLLDKGIVRAGI